MFTLIQFSLRQYIQFYLSRQRSSVSYSIYFEKCNRYRLHYHPIHMENFQKSLLFSCSFLSLLRQLNIADPCEYNIHFCWVFYPSVYLFSPAEIQLQQSYFCRKRIVLEELFIASPSLLFPLTKSNLASSEGTEEEWRVPRIPGSFWMNISRRNM